ncbi:hypothetical protein [Devosia sp.]|uniref:hypothetical protein n=1 Tax=Devosia sp. TaxID=1871048 RepID=UPI002603F8FA|nr:hypothetical protein [Devosia sp.]
MPRSAFGRVAGGSLLAFLVFQLAFPYITYGLAMATGCMATQGACGVVASIIPMALKPLALIALCVVLLIACARRAQVLGLPAWCGLAVPVLIGIDWMYLSLFGAHWGYAMAIGSLGATLPLHAFAGVILVIAMALFPEAAFRPKFGGATLAAALLLAASILLLMLTGLRTILMMRGFYIPFPLDEAALTGLIAALVALYRLVSVRRDEIPRSPERQQDFISHFLVGTFAGVPWKPLSAVALVTAFFAATQVMEILGPSAIFAIPIAIPNIILPTAALYLAILAAAYLLIVRRTFVSLVMLAIALLPIAHWFYLQQAARWDAEREFSEIRSIQTYKPNPLPRSVLIASRNASARSFAGIAGIDAVYLPDNGAYLRFANDGKQRPRYDAQPVAALPAEYLILRTGTESTYREAGRGRGGPFELVHMSPSGEKLVAVRYYGSIQPPAFLPVLMSSGWVPINSSVRSEDLSADIGRFVATALSVGQAGM